MAKKKEASLQQVWQFDQMLRDEFGPVLCGVDEAGRGPLAGPVVAAAVVLPSTVRPGVYYDSKQLTKKQREEAYDRLLEEAVDIGVGIVDHEYIDQYNILQATLFAMQSALKELRCLPNLVVVDGTAIPMVSMLQRKLIHGDALSQTVGAASIVAKVTRDRLMLKYDECYPVYGFSRHMGYGTKEHIHALKVHGPSPVHRRSFAPVRQLVVATDSRVPVMDTRRELGRLGEDLAVRYLEEKGFLCIERNWRVRLGEVDAIMMDKEALVFVEVRTRRSTSASDAFQLAAESIGDSKIHRLRLLADWYRRHNSQLQFIQVRLDVVLIHWPSGNGEPELIHYPGVI